jgi:hypothetical protein
MVLPDIVAQLWVSSPITVASYRHADRVETILRSLFGFGKGDRPPELMRGACAALERPEIRILLCGNPVKSTIFTFCYHSFHFTLRESL